IHQQRLFSLDDEQQAQHFLQIKYLLEESNYQHYEISNYAQPHFQSLHNSSYWDNTPYLGIGPSAHSFLSSQRMWNIANHHTYKKHILEKNILPLTQEILSKKQQFNEFILLSLRQHKGIDMKYIKQYWGITYHKHIIKQIKALKLKGWIIEEKENIRLSVQGMLFCDKATLSLFV
ncbi:MAG: hypothetical protein ACRC0A_04675, partial [Chitinophagaceae bacterium]